MVPAATLGTEPLSRIPSEIIIDATLSLNEVGAVAGDVSVTIGDPNGAGEVQKLSASATAVVQVSDCASV